MLNAFHATTQKRYEMLADVIDDNMPDSDQIKTNFPTLFTHLATKCEDADFECKYKQELFRRTLLETLPVVTSFQDVCCKGESNVIQQYDVAKTSSILQDGLDIFNRIATEGASYDYKNCLNQQQNLCVL